MAHRLPQGLLVALALMASAGAQTTLLSWAGVQGGQWFGSAVAIVGDINGDGFDDWAVGSPYFSGPVGPAGVVQVFAGPHGAMIATFTGGVALEQFGAAVAGAGDVDGDGHADVIVGAPGSNQGGLSAGRVLVLSGASGQVLRTWLGTAGMHLGYSVAGMGDIDGDLVPDILAGAPGAGLAPDTGAAVLWSGASGAVLRTWSGLGGGDQFGYVVASAGRVDLDSVPDVIIGAPYADPGGLVDAGQATVFSGATGVQLLLLSGSAPNDLLGFSVAGPGDVNGDQRHDLLVGIPRSGLGGPDAGLVRLYSGATGLALASWTGTQPGERLGRAVAAAGDRNHDGTPDLLMAAPTFGGPAGTAQGRVLVISGQGFQPLLTAYGVAASDEFGDCLAGRGDIDGNGRADLVVGAPRHGDVILGLNVGQVRVYPAEAAVAYGAGAAPANSMTLTWSGSLAPGNPFAVIAQGGPPSAPGFLFVGPRPAAIPFSGAFGSAVVLLDISVYESLLGIPIQTDLFGAFAVPGVIPPGSGFNGLSVFAQAFAASSATVALFTHGLQVTFGY